MPISGRRFCRLLEQNGWTLMRIKGSHHIYAKDGFADLASVPVHGNKPLRKGTLATLTRLTGVKAK